MAIRTKTIEYGFEGIRTNFLTGLLIGTATTVYVSAAGNTIGIAETAGRIFKSAFIEWGFRDSHTATGFRLHTVQFSTQLGVAASNITNCTITSGANANENEYHQYTVNLTNYFNTNFGIGTNQSIKLGIAVSSKAPVHIMSYANAKLYMTYNYDDVGIKTVTKTVRIPIQSSHNVLTTTWAAIGESGANPAPQNQIPALDTFLPEAIKNYQSAWIELHYNESKINAGAGMGSMLALFESGGGINTRAATQVDLRSAPYCRDIFLYSLSNTGVAKTLYLSSALDPGVIGGFINVTYFYDQTATSTVMNSLVLSIGGHWPFFIPGVSTGNNQTISKAVWIEDENPSLKQSAFMLLLAPPNSVATNYNLKIGSQAWRDYGRGAIAAHSGEVPIIHRIDHNSGIALTSKVFNIFNLRIFSNNVSNPTCLNTGYLYLNYTSNIASTNNENSKTTYWIVADSTSNANLTSVAINQLTLTGIGSTVVIADSNARIINLSTEFATRSQNSFAFVNLLASIKSNEFIGTGYYPLIHDFIRVAPGITGSGLARVSDHINLEEVNYLPNITNKFNPYHTRQWSILTTPAVTYINSIKHIVSFCDYSYTINGTIYNSGGGNVNITAYNTNNEPLNSTSRTGDGAYTLTVYTNTTCYVRAHETNLRQGISTMQIPNGINIFDIYLNFEFNHSF